MKTQNYFVQVTIVRGKIIENDDGSTTKEIIETIEDNLECFELEEDSIKRAEELI